MKLSFKSLYEYIKKVEHKANFGLAKGKIKIVEDETAAIASLDNDEWGIFNIEGTLVLYAKDTSGVASSQEFTSVV
jgi:hypothetical protein